MHQVTLVHLCGVCGAKVQETLEVGGWATESVIGPPWIPCPSCGALARTGRSEWADKNTWERFSYYGKHAFSGALGAVLWGGGGGALLVRLLRLEQSYIKWIFGGVSIVVAGRIFLNARREIAESLRRSRRGPPASA